MHLLIRRVLEVYQGITHCRWSNIQLRYKKLKINAYFLPNSCTGQMNMVSPRISHTASRFLAPLSRSDQPVYMLTTASWTAFDVGNIAPSWYMYTFLDMSLGSSVAPGKPYSTMKVPSLRTRPNSTSFLRLFLSFRRACGGKNTNGFSSCVVTHNIVHSYYCLGCNFSAKSWILTVEVEQWKKQKIDQEIHTWTVSGRKTPSTIGSKGMPPVVTRFCCTTRSLTSAACIQSWSSAGLVCLQPSNSPSFVDLNEWEVVFDKSRRTTEQIWCLTVTLVFGLGFEGTAC